MVEKALILEDAWFDNQVEGENVLIRVQVPDQKVTLFCLSDEDRQVVISFEDLEALLQLVEDARREWGNPKETEANES